VTYDPYGSDQPAGAAGQPGAPPPTPMTYATYQPTQPVRPTAVTVIAVLIIIYAALSLVALPINIMQMIGAAKATGPTAAMMQAPGMALLSWISVPLNGLSSVLWIAAGIGLLQLREWARKLTIGLLVYAIVMQMVSAVVAVPAVSGMMTSGAFGPAPPLPPGTMTLIIGAGVVFWLLILTGIAVLFMVLLTRPNVRYAFNPETDPAYAAYQPVYTPPPGSTDANQPPGGDPPSS